MKPLVINKEGVILYGALEGHVGKVVAFDSEQDKAILEFDKETFVTVSSEMIEQFGDD